MKNILYFAMILSLAFATSCSKNKDDGTWNTSLGKASFATAQTWKISGNGITQIWSDAVEIIDAKDPYDGGNSTDGFRIDFRSNPGQKGSLFSWRAVVEIANICPAGWRVPTMDDFIDLDIAMGGGTEDIRTDDSEFVIANNIGRWGGAFGGRCLSDGTLQNQGSWANYWSATQINLTSARTLNFSTNGNIGRTGWNSKDYGNMLRCVRN